MIQSYETIPFSFLVFVIVADFKNCRAINAIVLKFPIIISLISHNLNIYREREGERDSTKLCAWHIMHITLIYRYNELDDSQNVLYGFKRGFKYWSIFYFILIINY